MLLVLQLLLHELLFAFVLATKMLFVSLLLEPRHVAGVTQRKWLVIDWPVQFMTLHLQGMRVRGVVGVVSKCACVIVLVQLLQVFEA